MFIAARFKPDGILSLKTLIVHAMNFVLTKGRGLFIL